MTVYAHLFPTPIGDLFTAVDGSGAVLRLLFAAYRDRGDLTAGLRRPIEWNANHCAHVEWQVAEYFRNRRRAFDLEIELDGTPFQQQVWSQLRQIPFGETINYRQLADRLGRPAATRAVGRANASNPICLLIPCHRVIGTDGSLTGFVGGLDAKRRLLQHEGAL